MFDGMHDSWMWGMHWAWWIFWVLLIVVIVWGATRGGAGGRQPPQAGPSRETPMETLQRRYAEGEISTEEYEERKSRLQNR